VTGLVRDPPYLIKRKLSPYLRGIVADPQPAVAALVIATIREIDVSLQGETGNIPRFFTSDVSIH
jgi:hypothetical protein